MVRQLPVNIWPRRNLRPGEQDPARLRSRGQLAVKCSGLQTTRCSCFILTYLRTSSTSPGFLINCWASLPVPASAQCLKGMAEGTSQGPQRNESSFSNSRHLSFPPGRWANHSIMFLQVYQKITSTRATKQDKQTNKTPTASTWDSVFSTWPSIQYPCHWGLFAFAMSVLLPGRWVVSQLMEVRAG